jgi:hypothetical protein
MAAAVRVVRKAMAVAKAVRVARPMETALMSATRGRAATAAAFAVRAERTGWRYEPAIEKQYEK